AAALARPQPGYVAMVRRFRDLLVGSLLWDDGAARFLQDPLSFRCVAHVHGALRATLDALILTLETDLNSSTDNPLVLSEGDRVFSSAGFDATLLAIQFDALRLAWLHVGLTADRRVEKLITSTFSGLPGGLGLAEGVDGGIMIASYTCASLAAEARNLALPASLGIAPVAEGVEDHAGLAPLSVRRTLEMHSMLARIAAIELITAAEAVDRRKVTRLSRGGEAAYALTRAYAPPYGPEWQFAAEALAEHLRTRGIS
ncbi:MAG TPA: aromatic amino acid lyase, partial [Chloroflexota bacterium]